MQSEKEKWLWAQCRYGMNEILFQVKTGHFTPAVFLRESLVKLEPDKGQY